MRISPVLNTLVSVHKLSLTNKCFISDDVVDVNDINTDSIAEESSSEDSGSEIEKRPLSDITSNVNSVMKKSFFYLRNTTSMK